MKIVREHINEVKNIMPNVYKPLRMEYVELIQHDGTEDNYYDFSSKESINDVYIYYAYFIRQKRVSLSLSRDGYGTYHNETIAENVNSVEEAEEIIYDDYYKRIECETKNIREGLKPIKYEPLHQGSIKIPSNATELPKDLPKKITGNYECSETGITSLEGAPRYVGSNFTCLNTNIISLKGAPKTVGHMFSCSNTFITSLEYAPRFVGDKFFCRNINVPKEEIERYWKTGAVKGIIVSDYGNYEPYKGIKEGLKPLKYVPPHEGDMTIPSYATSIPKNLPKKITGDFHCSHTKITSLVGAPQYVGGTFDCDETNISSLEGAPEIIDGHFFCNDTKLNSLQGSPKSIGMNFFCSYNNKLTSLEGAPQSIGRNFYCYHTKISIEEIERYWKTGAVKGTIASDYGNYEPYHNVREGLKPLKYFPFKTSKSTIDNTYLFMLDEYHESYPRYFWEVDTTNIFGLDGDFIGTATTLEGAKNIIMKDFNDNPVIYQDSF